MNAANGLLANDLSGSALSIAANSQPANGQLTLNADGSFSYTPNAGCWGTDTFTCTATDGLTTSTPATVTITVFSIPVANADAYYVVGDTTLSVNTPGVLGNDTNADGWMLTAQLVTAPAHGQLTLNADGSFSYLPDAGFYGTDSFTYAAADAHAASAPATVTIAVYPPSAVQLLFTGQPSTAYATIAMTPPVQVTITDVERASHHQCHGCGDPRAGGRQRRRDARRRAHPANGERRGHLQQLDDQQRRQLYPAGKRHRIDRRRQQSLHHQPVAGADHHLLRPTSDALGQVVTLTGTFFTGAAAVTFNGVAAASYTVVNDTTITASVPTGATSGPLSVATLGGTSTSASNFTFIPAPIITSFSPTSGGAGMGVTITGTYFTGATAVAFHGTAATAFTVVSDTSYPATVGSGATGTITVTTAGGTATSTGTFTFIPAPTITSFTPTSGGTGTLVTLTGDELHRGDRSVLWRYGGNSASPSLATPPSPRRWATAPPGRLP